MASNRNGFLCLKYCSTNVTMRAFCETCGGTCGSNGSISCYCVSLGGTVLNTTNRASGFVGTCCSSACVNVVSPLSIKGDVGINFVFVEIPRIGEICVGKPAVEDIISSCGICRSCKKTASRNLCSFHSVSAIGLEGYAILFRRNLLKELVASRKRQY